MLTVAEALEGLAGGKFTSESLVLAYLVQIEKYEPFYNAFTFFNEFAIEEVRPLSPAKCAPCLACCLWQHNFLASTGLDCTARGIG